MWLGQLWCGLMPRGSPSRPTCRAHVFACSAAVHACGAHGPLAFTPYWAPSRDDLSSVVWHVPALGPAQVRHAPAPSLPSIQSTGRGSPGPARGTTLEKGTEGHCPLWTGLPPGFSRGLLQYRTPRTHSVHLSNCIPLPANHHEIPVGRLVAGLAGP